MVGSQRKHDWLQQKLYNHPELVGVVSSNIVLKAMEYELLYMGHTLTIPDVYYRTNDKYSHFIEVKSGNNSTLYSKGMSQLEKTCLWAEEYGLKKFETKLVMPRDDNETLWINMLDNLDIYSLGDSYRGRL